MKKKVFFALAIGGVALGVFSLSHCSLVGLGIGSLIDSSKPNSVQIEGWEVQKITPGKRIDVLLKKGDTVSGKFLGVERIPYEEYAVSYNKTRDQDLPGLLLPSLGERITIVDSAGKTIIGRFRGFDYQGLWLETESQNLLTLVALRDIGRINDGGGNAIEITTLNGLLSKGKLPIRTAAALQTASGKTLIAIQQINQISVHASKSGKWEGLAIGAIADTIIAVLVVSALNRPMFGQCQPGAKSCPLFYSYNGDTFVLDAETFGGAIFEKAQRTDWTCLDHMRSVGGLVRLKITNELQEIQHVDQIKVFAVDHPKGSTILPTHTGQLQVLSGLHPPLRALDAGGCDVRELVRADDDREWVSNPFGRNPEDKSQVRDGLVIEFARPQDSATVNLVFNVRNTLWASYLQGQILQLTGKERRNWYALMNSSPVARAALEKAMIREGMLLVKVWNGGNWQDAGFVWEVGPNIAKRLAVLVDIRHILGNILRIKLESTAGLWTINSVMADYTPDLPVEVTELAVVQAKDQSGRDVRDLLAISDGRYLEMPHIGDWAELVFNTPPYKRDRVRSFVLKSSGYYEILLPAEGQFQTELMNRLMSEPGAYGQYTLQLLNKSVRDAFSQSGDK